MRALSLNVNLGIMQNGGWTQNVLIAKFLKFLAMQSLGRSLLAKTE